MASISTAFNKMLLSTDFDFKRNPSDMSLASSCEELHMADSAYASPRPISLLVSEPVDAECAGDDENEIDSLLLSKDEWDFDLHKLDDLTGGRPLALLAASILSDRGLLDELNIDRDALTAYLAAAEDAYSPDESAVSFHNSLHAADVLHGVHCLLNTPTLTGYFTPLEIFAALIAAAVHDVDHPGRSNTFLIKTADPLASQYNGVSVLENHHITTAFRLMEQPGCNFIAGLDAPMQEQFHQLVTRIILSTDMSKHNACRSAFASIVEQMQRVRGDTPLSTPTGDGNSHRRSSILAHPLEDPDNRASVLGYILHCVDIGASTKPWQTLKPWVSRIFTEFFNEGDAEVEMHLQVGELNSRKVDIAHTQKGFITFVVAPLWQLWSQFVTPEQCRVQLENLRFNMEAWSGLSGSSPSSEFIEEYRLPRPHVNSFKREASLSAVVGLYPHGRQPRKVTRQQSM